MPRRRKKRRRPLADEVAYLTIGPMSPEQGLVLRSQLQRQGLSLGMDLKVKKIHRAHVIEEVEKKKTEKEEE